MNSRLQWMLSEISRVGTVPLTASVSHDALMEPVNGAIISVEGFGAFSTLIEIHRS